MGNIQEACCGRPSSSMKKIESIGSSTSTTERRRKTKRKRRYEYHSRYTKHESTERTYASRVFELRRRIVHHWPYDSLDGNWMSIRDAYDVEDKERAIKRWMIWITDGYEKAVRSQPIPIRVSLSHKRNTHIQRVRGFSSRAWKTGYAFCAIISRVLPKKLDYDDGVLKNNELTQVQRLRKAFKIVESELGLKRPERLLQDILSKNPKDAHDAISRTLLLDFLLKLQPEVDSRLACMHLSDEEEEDDDGKGGSGTDTE